MVSLTLMATGLSVDNYSADVLATREGNWLYDPEIQLLPGCSFSRFFTIGRLNLHIESRSSITSFKQEMVGL